MACPIPTDLVAALLRGAPPVLRLQETLRATAEGFIQPLSGPLSKVGFDTDRMTLAVERDLRNLSDFALNTSGKADRFWDRLAQPSNPFQPGRLSRELRTAVHCLLNVDAGVEPYVEGIGSLIPLSTQEILAATATDEGPVAMKIVASLGDMHDYVCLKLTASAAFTVNPGRTQLLCGIGRAGILLSSLTFIREADLDSKTIFDRKTIDEHLDIEASLALLEEDGSHPIVLSDVTIPLSLKHRTRKGAPKVDWVSWICDEHSQDDTERFGRPSLDLGARAFCQARGTHLGIGRVFSHFETDPTP